MEAATPTEIGSGVGVTVKHSARLTGAVALAGGVIAWAGIVLHLAATNLEVDLMQHAPAALSLSIPRQELYIYSLWCAALGLYLPFLFIGNFMWRRLRDGGEVFAGTGLMAMGIYVMLGIVGCGALISALMPLSAIHASGDPMLKSAAEVAWSTLIVSAQGLSTWEAPVFVLWGIAACGHLRSERWGFGRLLAADLWLFAIHFVLQLVDMPRLAGAEGTLIVIIHPLWIVLFGVDVLRGGAPSKAVAGAAGRGQI